MPSFIIILFPYFFLLGVSPEFLNLFEVMASVDPMKLSPLPRGQGSEDGMIEQSRALTKAGFTLRDHFVHG